MKILGGTGLSTVAGLVSHNSYRAYDLLGKMNRQHQHVNPSLAFTSHLSFRIANLPIKIVEFLANNNLEFLNNYITITITTTTIILIIKTKNK